MIEIDHLLPKKIVSLPRSTRFPPRVSSSNNKRILQPSHSLRIDHSRLLVIMLIYRLPASVNRRTLDRDNAQYLSLWVRRSTLTNEPREYRHISHLLSIRQLSRLFLHPKYPNRQYRRTKRHYPLSRLSISHLHLLVLHLVRLPLLMPPRWCIPSGRTKICRRYH